jgi:hypothetical protein
MILFDYAWIAMITSAKDLTMSAFPDYILKVNIQSQRLWVLYIQSFEALQQGIILKMSVRRSLWELTGYSWQVFLWLQIATW